MKGSHGIRRAFGVLVLNSTDLEPFVEDGTVIGHMLLDEPRDSTWEVRRGLLPPPEIRAALVGAASIARERTAPAGAREP